jgi:hypothetical protein
MRGTDKHNFMSPSKQLKSFHALINTKLVNQPSMITNGHNGLTFYANIDMQGERESCHPYVQNIRYRRLDFPSPSFAIFFSLFYKSRVADGEVNKNFLK